MFYDVQTHNNFQVRRFSEMDRVAHTGSSKDGEILSSLNNFMATNVQKSQTQLRPQVSIST
jgi:hypothetical protein